MGHKHEQLLGEGFAKNLRKGQLEGNLKAKTDQSNKNLIGFLFDNEMLYSIMGWCNFRARGLVNTVHYIKVFPC